MVKLEFESIEEFITFAKVMGVNPQGNYEKKFVEFDNKINQICELLLTLQQKLPKKTAVKKPATTKTVAQNTIRKYTETQKKRLPKIKRMTDEGKFELYKSANRKYASYTIEDILKLKSRIPNVKEYPSWQAISDDMEISHFTAHYVCYGIETGYFDKYIKQWEQLKANEYYGNWKPVTVENNPQKRREQGMR